MPEPERPGRLFVGRALAAMAGEQPRSYERLLAKMRQFELLLELCDEQFVVVFAPTGARTVAGGSAASLAPPRMVARADASTPVRTSRCTHSEQARVRSSYATLFALVDGHLSLLDALLQERLQVFGSLSAVATLERGFAIFLQGGVATESIPQHLATFRGQTVQESTHVVR